MQYFLGGGDDDSGAVVWEKMKWVKNNRHRFSREGMVTIACWELQRVFGLLHNVMPEFLVDSAVLLEKIGDGGHVQLSRFNFVPQFLEC